MAKVKRTRLEQIYDLLVCIRDHGIFYTPTKLMCKSNLSNGTYKEIIKEMLEKGFIKENTEYTHHISRGRFTITESGTVTISQIESTMKIHTTKSGERQ